MNASDLDDLCPVIGYRATRIVAAWFAGRYLHAPTRPSASHPLVSLIGRSALDALIREMPGERFWIPTSDEDDRYRRDRCIAERFAAGKSTAEIAEEFQITQQRAIQIRVELVERGWLEYAQGFDTAMTHTRGRWRRDTAAPSLIRILGTGEVSGDPPPPCADPGALAVSASIAAGA